MKYIISLIFAAIVCGQSKQTLVSSTKELCNIEASVFSSDPTIADKSSGEILLAEEVSVKACKEVSRAKVFRKYEISDLDDTEPVDSQIKHGRIAFDKLNSLFGRKENEFYDGLEFDISSLNKTMIGRLAKEVSNTHVFSLVMSLDNWDEVGTSFSKYATKIHHVILVVDGNKKSLKALEKVVRLNPNVTFSVRFSLDEPEVKNLANKMSTYFGRKIGYTIPLESKRNSDLLYTAGI